MIEGGAGRRLEEKVKTAEETKSSDFGSKREETKEGYISTLPFPLSPRLSAIDPVRPQAGCIIIFGAKLNRKKSKQS